MAWFKFGPQNAAAAQGASTVPKVPTETVETMRTRAKRRLIGALVLVLTAVVGFPMLFETQPRPALVDVPIEIPDKNSVKPLAPALPSAPAAAAKVDDKASLGGKEEIVSAAPSAPFGLKEKGAVASINTAPSATKTIANSTPNSPPTPDKTAADKAAAEKLASAKAATDKAAAKLAQEKAASDKIKAEKVKAEAVKAQALLDGKTAAAATAVANTPAAASSASDAARFIVQFGSFADESKAREVRQKVERAGLKTYAQTAETAEGKRHRARVGPFATRAEAEKAAAKIKALDLPANILSL